MKNDRLGPLRGSTIRPHEISRSGSRRAGARRACTPGPRQSPRDTGRRPRCRRRTADSVCRTRLCSTLAPQRLKMIKSDIQTAEWDASKPKVNYSVSGSAAPGCHGFHSSAHSMARDCTALPQTAAACSGLTPMLHGDSPPFLFAGFLDSLLPYAICIRHIYITWERSFVAPHPDGDLKKQAPCSSVASGGPAGLASALASTGPCTYTEWYCKCFHSGSTESKAHCQHILEC